MEVKIENSTTLKPIYDPDRISVSAPAPAPAPARTTSYIPLTAFDKVAYNGHVAILYAYPPGSMPTTATLKLGLQRVLAIYRELAGRFGKNPQGEGPADYDVILLNDLGARFVEASVETRLDYILTFLNPSPALLSLHPALEGVEELLQVQVTRFGCGSAVIGVTVHHLVADGPSMGNFFVAWSRVCRGLDAVPLPFHDLSSYIVPRDPPRIEFDHLKTEFISREIVDGKIARLKNVSNDIVMHRVRFSEDFLIKLKARAPGYTRFECVMAHLWRAITTARSLSKNETTHMRIAVNGRWRIMNPRGPEQYFGNLVLWAIPESTVRDLLHEPLSHAATLIHDAVSKVDDGYFRSFNDFMTASASASAELLEFVPDVAVKKRVMSPDVDVNSWLGLRFDELDFGGGEPDMVMPMYCPLEGNIFLLSSYDVVNGDRGGVDVFASVFRDQLDLFIQSCCDVV